MIRLAVVAMCAAVVFAGCDRRAVPRPAARGPKAPAEVRRAPQANTKEPQTPIVRSLIDAIDAFDDESNEVKAELKRTLREADKELRHVLGDNSKRKILEVNKKPPIPIVGEIRKPPPASKKAQKPADNSEG